MAGSFAIDLEKFSAKTERRIDKVIRWVGLELLRRIIMRSPVDTGRFRGNWHVTLNDAPREATLVIDPIGSTTIEEGDRVISGFDLGDSIFIVNNLAYAEALERGHSQQAPAGMVAITLSEFHGIVEEGTRGTL